MAKNVILITNNELIIEENKDLAHIENSLYLAKDLFEQYSYIIIDYDILIIEESLDDKIREYEDKILILGDGYIGNLRSLSIEEFHIENIDLYFGYEPGPEVLYNKDLDMDANLEIDRIINLYTGDKLAREALEELMNAPSAVRSTVYRVIKSIDNGVKIKSLKWNNPIRIEYTFENAKKLKKNIKNKLASL